MFSGRSENSAGPVRQVGAASESDCRSAPSRPRTSASQKIRVSDELGSVGGRGTVIDFARRCDLLQFSHAQQRDAVRHHHGFFLIMRNKDEGDADFSLQGLQFHLHLPPQVGVERRQRFIEQQQSRTVHQSAGQRDPLLLAAADLRWLRLRMGRHLDLAPAPAPRARQFLLGRFATRRPYPTFCSTVR